MTTSGGVSRTISYDYDVLGNKRSMITPGAKTVLYGYDSLSRLSTVTHPDGAVTTFGYDKVGNRQSVTRATSTGTVFSTTAYTYDPLNRLTDIVNRDGNNAIVSSYHYQLRADGKRLSVTDGTGTTTYSYDDQVKLTLEAGPYATIAYAYDNVGNRLTRMVTSAATGSGTTLVNGVTNTAYDANDRIIGHTYDANGSETTVNGQTASYDFENHLVSLGSAANYVYDADGNRYSVASAGTTTSYVVDTSLPYASVVEEYSSATPSARYDYGDDLVRMDRGGIYYYLYDGLGSTRQLVNTSGGVTDSYGYSAFGEMASHTGSTVNPFLFNAQQFDGASGNYFLRARYYDQSAGRFISQDPFGGSDGDPISLHRYLYAGNDPVDMVDPGGQDETLFGVSMSTAVYSSLIGGTFSAAFGAWDTALNGGSSVDVLKSTAIGFALGAALGYGSTVQVLSAASRLIGIGFAISGAAGSYKAYQQGNTVLAIYRGMASTLGFTGSAGIIRSFLDDQTQVVPRTANDAALGPNAVPQQANGGAGGRQVNPVQLAEFNRDLAAAQAQRATDIRTDQPQVNANGNLVGNNRPDLQYTLNLCGCHSPVLAPLPVLAYSALSGAETL